MYIKEENFLKEIEKFADVLIIDHHQIIKDYNSEKIVFLNAQGFCATYLCYYLFSKIKNIEYFDWLVACACIADWMYSQNENFMKKVFEKYGQKFNGKRLDDLKKTKFWELQYNLILGLIYYDDNLMKAFNFIGKNISDVKDLEKHAAEVQVEIKELNEKFEEEKQEINGRIYFEYEPKKFGITSIVSNFLSLKYFNKTIILLKIDKKENSCKISARRQDRKESMNLLLSNLVKDFENGTGGGHIPAAGGSFPLKYKKDFIEKLKRLPAVD